MGRWSPEPESKFLVFIAFWAIRLDLRTNRRANETLIPPLKRIEGAVIIQPPALLWAFFNCYSTNADLLKSILKKNCKSVGSIVPVASQQLIPDNYLALKSNYLHRLDRRSC